MSKGCDAGPRGPGSWTIVPGPRRPTQMPIMLSTLNTLLAGKDYLQGTKGCAEASARQHAARARVPGS